MPPTTTEVEAGQAIYTPRMLKIYDLLVLVFSNRFVWKCPTSRQLAAYDTNVTGNHLDVGVGSGYFLHRCTFPSTSPRIALMDMNPNSLEFAANRIARYRPEIYVRNVLEPIEFEAERFDSVALNYLLHCLPGSMEEKSVVFDHLKPLMKPGAVLFGTTLLDEGLPKSRAAKRLMQYYRDHGVFSNENDGLETLDRMLRDRFDEVKIDTRGCGALFVARGA